MTVYAPLSKIQQIQNYLIGQGITAMITSENETITSITVSAPLTAQQQSQIETIIGKIQVKLST